MILVESNSKEAAFYFAVEEMFTRYLRKNEQVLMLWRTDKTVMIGSNQVVEAEVNAEFASNSEIQIVRRSSGGGAIYTDPGTVLYTDIRPLTAETGVIREEVATSVISALNKMGVPSKREGKNDITVDGKKISGFAQYTSGKHVCTHCSLLYDTDLETLTNVLIANEKKLRPKGIASIRSRVTNIRPFVKEDFPVEDFITKIKNYLLNGVEYTSYNFTPEELEKINTIRKEKYTNPNWNLRM